MPQPGFGGNFGSNYGGGGVIYLTNLSPEPGGTIPPDNTISFTVGVQGSLIDLSSVQITISAQAVFSGFTPIGGYIVGVADNVGLFEITTSTAHGLSTGQQVNIIGAVGAPINGTWTVTFNSLTQFTLQGSSYVAGYASGGLVSLPPAFTTDFITSSYAYSVPDNGYTFTIVSSGTLPLNVVVNVVANTTDGGTSNQTYTLGAVQPVVYPPTPLGVPLVNVPLGMLSGEAQTGILAGGQGQVFFSPALPAPNTGSQLDVQTVETDVRAADSYNPAPPGRNSNNRPWLWGPPTAVPPARAYPPDFVLGIYEPTWNSWNVPNQAPFVFLKTTQAQATGVLTDVPTGHTTIILY
jgi:hypothetical protein